MIYLQKTWRLKHLATLSLKYWVICGVCLVLRKGLGKVSPSNISMEFRFLLRIKCIDCMICLSNKKNRWCFQIFFIFTPTWENDSHFDEHIFQNGLKPTTSARVGFDISFQLRSNSALPQNGLIRNEIPPKCHHHQGIKRKNTHLLHGIMKTIFTFPAMEKA